MRMSNTLITEADEKIIRACAWQAIRKRPPGVELADLKQAAREALLRSIIDGRMPSEPNHRERFVYTRSRGAMIDLYRAEHGRNGEKDVIDWYAEASDAGDGVADAEQVAEYRRTWTSCHERREQIREAIETLVHKGTPQMLACIDMLAAGYEAAEVAAALDVDPSRISKLKAEARELIACCL